jgi:methionyl-tRNA synthetase
LDPAEDVPNGTRFDCGMEISESRADMKHVERVTMKVAKVKDGKFLGMDVDLPEGAPERIVAVIDGDKAVPLSAGGCLVTVESDITDGAPAL